MEAATPLLFSQVRVAGGRLYVDGLVVEDETAVRLADEHADPARLVEDAIEIGARILDREQTGADIEVVRKELEKTSSDVSAALSATTERVNGELVARLVELFGSGESPGAVPQRVNSLVEKVMAGAREDLRRQFSTADGNNPLALFQKAALDSINAATARQQMQLGDVNQRLEAMKLEIASLRAEKEKLEEVAAEAERGTAKGRPYEEAVFEALEAIASGHGDDCTPVGDETGAGGRKGDVVVAIDACSGPARGRIVFEAKNAQPMSKNKAFAYLDTARATRDADYAVLVVPSEDRLPARTQQLREFNGDKLLVAYNPEDGSRIALEVAYGLARARVLMKRGEAAGIDTEAVVAEVERALDAMSAVSSVKAQLTQAKTAIDRGSGSLDTLAMAVRSHLAQISSLVEQAEDE